MCSKKRIEDKLNFIQNSSYTKNIIRFSTKKGKKEISEKNLRKSFYHFSKLNKQENFLNYIKLAVKKTSVCFSIKIKRKGSKNINTPIYLHKNKQLFLKYKLLLENLDKKHYSEDKYYKRLILSILDTTENKSIAVKKKTELYKLIEENMNI